MEQYNKELCHHGIKGQKWGVRRYQNLDGSLTSAGKDRYSSGNSKSGKSGSSNNSGRTKKIAKAVGVGLLAAGTVTAAALYVKSHPEVAVQVAGMGNVLNAKVKDLGAKGVANGKNFVQRAVQKGKNAGIVGGMIVREQANNAKESFKEGIREGIKEAPKKAAKAIVVGAAMNAAKRGLDYAVGKEEAARIMQANNNKKIDKFWKINDDRDKDDD